jgi:hypothetical protein
MTYNDARDEILTPFWLAWRPFGYTAIFTDVPGSVPDTNDIWARVTIKHVTGNQASLADPQSKRCWRRDGFVTVQVFSPAGDGLVQGYDAAQAVTNSYQCYKNCNVWFRNTKLEEIGNDGAFFQVNVTSNFTYFDLR